MTLQSGRPQRRAATRRFPQSPADSSDVATSETDRYAPAARRAGSGSVWSSNGRGSKSPITWPAGIARRDRAAAKPAVSRRGQDLRDLPASRRATGQDMGNLRGPPPDRPAVATAGYCGGPKSTRQRAAAGPDRASSVVWSPVLEHQKPCSETWPQRIHQGAFPAPPADARLGQHTLEYEHHGRRRHVTVIAQHAPCLGQRSLFQVEGTLERRDYLGAARMAHETVDVPKPELVAGEEVGGDIAQLRCNELGNVTGKDRAEPVVGDFPTHDIETVRPSMLAGSNDGGAVAVGRQQSSRCSIAEQCRRDNVALRPVVSSKGERAELNG